MGCTNCKKKKVIKDRHATKQNIEESIIVAKQNNVKKKTKQNIIDIDKTLTWIIISWFLLGAYGLYMLIKNIINIIL